MENKKKLDKTTKVLIGIFVIIVLLIGLLFSYAYYSLDVGGTLSNSNITGTLECLDISYTESNSINLTNAHPVTDEYALTKMTPVTVTITNNCSRNQGDISYTLALSTIYEKVLNYNDKYIPDTKIRTHVKKTVEGTETTKLNTNFLSKVSKLDPTSNSYKYITNNFTSDSNYTNYNMKDMYRLDSGLIKNNEVITYKVYMWIDYYEGDPDRVGGEYNNSTKGKKFEGAISLVANAEEYVEPTLAKELIASGELWQSGIEGDGYRYTGSGNATASTTPKNFICFGTTSLTECKANEDKYMYRIIGVFPDDAGEQHLKLIKYANFDLGSSIATDIIDLLNSNAFLSNSSYSYMQDNNWINKIVNWDWLYFEGWVNLEEDAQVIYLYERGSSSSTYNAKVGTPYLSDYKLSLGKEVANNEILKTGWYHYLNNKNNSSITQEYTANVYADDTGVPFAIGIDDDGQLYRIMVMDGESGNIRPNFYLASEIKKIAGDGSYDNPYLIE